MILFRLVSWPYVRKHGLRTVLTILGIALGVAVYVSMHLANQAVLGTFADTVNRIAGAAQLQISAGEPGFDETVLERIQAPPEVGWRCRRRGRGRTDLAGQGNLLILGVDMTGDRSLRDYALDAVKTRSSTIRSCSWRSPTRSSSRRSSRPQRHPLGHADAARDAADGEAVHRPRHPQVRRLNSAFGGNLAIMDVYAAQHVFGRGRKFDRIDLAATEGVARRRRCRRRCSERSAPGSTSSPRRRAAAASSRCRGSTRSC